MSLNNPFHTKKKKKVIKGSFAKLEVLYSKKFSSAKNFVTSDRQAVRQEFIFVKRRVARFVFGRSVRLLIVYLHIHDYFWSHTCRFEENLVRNLI